MNFKTLFGNLAVLGVFTLAMMSFIIITQNDNSVSEPLGSHNLINDTYGNLYSNLSNSKTSAEQSSEDFLKRSPDPSLGELNPLKIFSVLKTFRAMTVGLWNIYIKLPMVILGVSPVVASVISTILLLLLIIGAWAILKGAIS